MRIVLCALLVLSLAPAAHAQPPAPRLRGELARADFLVGEWLGDAWVKYAPDGEPRPAHATAQGKAVLSGISLAMASVARTGDRVTEVVNENDVSLRFRRDSSAFRVLVHLPGTVAAAAVDGWARVEGCELQWGYEMPNAAGDRYRFTIRVDEANRRTETGERSTDGGRTWWRYYGAEMAGRTPGGCRPPPAPPAPGR